MVTARTSCSPICPRHGQAVLNQSFTGRMAVCCEARMHAWKICSAVRRRGSLSRSSFCTDIWIRALAELISIESTCAKLLHSTNRGRVSAWPFMRLRGPSETSAQSLLHEFTSWLSWLQSVRCAVNHVVFVAYRERVIIACDGRIRLLPAFEKSPPRFTAFPPCEAADVSPVRDCLGPHPHDVRSRRGRHQRYAATGIQLLRAVLSLPGAGHRGRYRGRLAPHRAIPRAALPTRRARETAAVCHEPVRHRLLQRSVGTCGRPIVAGSVFER